MWARRPLPKSQVIRRRRATIIRRLSQSPLMRTRRAPRSLTRAHSWRNPDARERENVMRALLLAIALGALATSAQAQSMEVVGYAGVLGEWELTASVIGDS